MISSSITYTLPGHPTQVFTLEPYLHPEYIHGLWLGDRGVKDHVIERIEQFDHKGTTVHIYDAGKLQDANLTGLVIDEGDYDFEVDEHPGLTWREFVLSLTNSHIPTKRYTAKMVEEYGDTQEVYVIRFDSLEFVQGVIEICRVKGADWTEIISHIHDSLDKVVDVTTLA